MKILSGVSLLFVLAIALLSGCQQEPPLSGAATHIPSTATAVTGIDLDRLLKKADFDSVKNMEFYREMVKKAETQNPIISKVLQAPYQSGIDLSQKIFLVTNVHTTDPKHSTFHVLIPLADAGKFKNLVKAAGLSISTKDGLKMAGMEESKEAVMVWDNHLLVLSFNKMEEANAETPAIRLFNLEKGASLATNSHFVEALKEPRDLITWFSSNALADQANATGMLHLLDVDAEALKDNYIFGYGDFEKGIISGRARFYFNRQMRKNLLGRFLKKGTETDFSPVLSATNLHFAVTGALHLRGIDHFLSERPQSRKFADIAIGDFGGLNRKQLLETLNGDLLVASYKTDMEDNGHGTIIALALKSKKKAKKLLQQAVEENKIKEKEPPLYQILQTGGENFTLRINKGMGGLLLLDDLLVFSLNEELLIKIKNKEWNTGSRKIKEVLRHFDDQFLGIWVNNFELEYRPNALLPNTSQIFQDMRFNININGAELLMKTNNPDENSLRTIIKMIDEEYLNNHRKIM